MNFDPGTPFRNLSEMLETFITKSFAKMFIILYNNN